MLSFVSSLCICTDASGVMRPSFAMIMSYRTYFHSLRRSFDVCSRAQRMNGLVQRKILKRILARLAPADSDSMASSFIQHMLSETESSHEMQTRLAKAQRSFCLIHRRNVLILGMHEAPTFAYSANSSGVVSPSAFMSDGCVSDAGGLKPHIPSAETTSRHSMTPNTTNKAPISTLCIVIFSPVRSATSFEATFNFSASPNFGLSSLKPKKSSQRNHAAGHHMRVSLQWEDHKVIYTVRIREIPLKNLFSQGFHYIHMTLSSDPLCIVFRHTPFTPPFSTWLTHD